MKEQGKQGAAAGGWSLSRLGGQHRAPSFLLRVAASAGHNPAQRGGASPCAEDAVLGPGRDKGSHGRSRQAAGGSCSTSWGGTGRGRGSPLAWAVIACMPPYGHNQSADPSLLPAVVEGLMPRSTPPRLVTVLPLTTTTLMGLSAKLLVRASLGPLESKRAVLAQAVETQGLPASISWLVNRSRKAGRGGDTTGTVCLSAGRVVISSADRPGV